MSKQELMQWQIIQLERMKEIERTIARLDGKKNWSLIEQLREDAISIMLTLAPTSFQIIHASIERYVLQAMHGTVEELAKDQLSPEEEALYQKALE